MAIQDASLTRVGMFRKLIQHEAQASRSFPNGLAPPTDASSVDPSPPRRVAAGVVVVCIVAFVIALCCSAVWMLIRVCRPGESGTKPIRVMATHREEVHLGEELVSPQIVAATSSPILAGPSATPRARARESTHPLQTLHASKEYDPPLVDPADTVPPRGVSEGTSHGSDPRGTHQEAFSTHTTEAAHIPSIAATAAGLEAAPTQGVIPWGPVDTEPVDYAQRSPSYPDDATSPLLRDAEEGEDGEDDRVIGNNAAFFNLRDRGISL